jgi:solute carrier family 26 (sodium-independent sulfate anion transporter), member 11
MVLLCLGLLTSTLKYMPKAALAAVVICAVIFMIEIHEVTISLWKSKSKHLLIGILLSLALCTAKCFLKVLSLE